MRIKGKVRDLYSSTALLELAGIGTNREIVRYMTTSLHQHHHLNRLRVLNKQRGRVKSWNIDIDVMRVCGGSL